MWELRGCPYCQDTHLINLADPDVAGFIRERFAILQFNRRDLEVTDFNGTVLPERDLVARDGTRYTSTIQFFPESADGLDDLPPRELEVARFMGHLEPDAFRRSFAYVSERAYEEESLQQYLERTA